MNEELIKEHIKAMREYTHAVSQLAASISVLVDAMMQEENVEEEDMPTKYLNG